MSFDRPYSQPTEGAFAHDWYGRTDVATVSWLEHQGYDVTYVASEDIHTNGAQLKNHRVFVSGGHDEYWSSEMFNAAIAARNSGTSLFFTGANAAYWRVRFADGPQSGKPNRLMIAYKTVESGPEDPSGTSTSTWRDPAGPNRPENELIGQMYVGDNANTFFPLRVSAEQGQSRVWRHTSLASLPAGTSANVGTDLVGWEWDARVDNGAEPPGVTAVAASPVNGGLVFNQMSETLERTEQRRLEAIGDLAHELRTPLSSIKSMMEGLVDGVLATEPATFLTCPARGRAVATAGARSGGTGARRGEPASP